MLKVSEASSFKNLNSKTDLVWLIRERAKIQGKDMKGYTHKNLNSYSKPQLFCMFGKIDLD